MESDQDVGCTWVLGGSHWEGHTTGSWNRGCNWRDSRCWWSGIYASGELFHFPGYTCFSSLELVLSEMCSFMAFFHYMVATLSDEKNIVIRASVLWHCTIRMDLLCIHICLAQGVTLGGTGKAAGDRHPKIREGVLLGAGANYSRETLWSGVVRWWQQGPWFWKMSPRTGNLFQFLLFSASNRNSPYMIEFFDS